ncbi:MAG: hypothetical protein ACW972_10710 [Promethearchaeota archaeon]|jgi:hypothetical protein
MNRIISESTLGALKKIEPLPIVRVGLENSKYVRLTYEHFTIEILCYMNGLNIGELISIESVQRNKNPD